MGLEDLKRQYIELRLDLAISGGSSMKEIVKAYKRKKKHGHRKVVGVKEYEREKKVKY